MTHNTSIRNRVRLSFIKSCFLSTWKNQIQYSFFFSSTFCLHWLLRVMFDSSGPRLLHYLHQLFANFNCPPFTTGHLYHGIKLWKGPIESLNYILFFLVAPMLRFWASWAVTCSQTESGLMVKSAVLNELVCSLQTERGAVKKHRNCGEKVEAESAFGDTRYNFAVVSRM